MICYISKNHQTQIDVDAIRDVLVNQPAQHYVQKKQSGRQFMNDDDHYFLDHHDDQLRKYYYYGFNN